MTFMERLFKGFFNLIKAEFILYGVLAALGCIVYLLQLFFKG